MQIRYCLLIHVRVMFVKPSHFKFVICSRFNTRSKTNSEALLLGVVWRRGLMTINREMDDAQCTNNVFSVDTEEHCSQRR